MNKQFLDALYKEKQDLETAIRNYSEGLARGNHNLAINLSMANLSLERINLLIEKYISTHNE